MCELGKNINSNRLLKFITRTFGEEGGYQNHPRDKGNYFNNQLYGTIWGITARDHFTVFIQCYNAWKDNNIELSKQIAMKFYIESHYWNEKYDLINDSSLAFRLWDFGVNAGVVKAVKLLQKTLNKYYNANLKEDGIFGKYTLLATNRYSHPSIRFYKNISDLNGETECYYFYVKEIEKYYRSLKNFVYFGKGWLKRLKRVFNDSSDLFN